MLSVRMSRSFLAFATIIEFSLRVWEVLTSLMSGREEKMRVQEREEAMLAMHQELEEWRRKHAQLLRKSVEAEQNASSQRLTAQPPASSPPRSPSASYGE